MNKALSGAEIREAILFDIRKALETDDRFSAHLAYDGFSFISSLTVSLPSAVLESQKFIRVIAGESSGYQAGDAEIAQVDASRPLQSPNDVRYDTEQPIPVLTTDEKGNTVEKRVSYVGKDRAGRPKGHKAVPSAPPVTERVKRNVVKGIDGLA